MKGQIRRRRHCPSDQLPDCFEALIDGVVYYFAIHVGQPEKASNQALYNVFVEDGLSKVKDS